MATGTTTTGAWTLATATKERTPKQQAALYDHYLVTRDSQFPQRAKAVTDLEATVLNYLERPLPATHDPDAIAEILTETVIHALYGADITREKVRGIGIGLAGVIHSRAGATG